MEINDSETSEVLCVKGVPYLKGADGRLLKMGNEEFDEDSNLIYR